MRCSPERIEAWLELGELYRVTGHYEEARRVAELGVSHTAGQRAHWRLAALLARVDAEMGDSAIAIDAYERAVREAEASQVAIRDRPELALGLAAELERGPREGWVRARIVLDEIDRALCSTTRTWESNRSLCADERNALVRLFSAERLGAVFRLPPCPECAPRRARVEVGVLDKPRRIDDKSPLPRYSERVQSPSVLQLRPGLRVCFAHSLSEDPNQSGKLSVLARISASGAVDNVKLVSAAGNLSQPLQGCARALVATAKLPLPGRAGMLVPIGMWFEPEPAPTPPAETAKVTPSLAGSSAELDLPAVPEPTQAAEKFGDDFTVWGAWHLLHSRVHAPEVASRAESVVGYIVRTNYEDAPLCALQPPNEVEPPDCAQETAQFEIADTPSGTGPHIRVVGYAFPNFGALFTAQHKRGSWGLVPSPLPAVPARVRVWGPYSARLERLSTPLLTDYRTGVLEAQRFEYLEKSDPSLVQIGPIPPWASRSCGRSTRSAQGPRGEPDSAMDKRSQELVGLDVSVCEHIHRPTRALNGQIELTLEVGTDGRVTHVGAKPCGEVPANVVACVVDHSYELQFHPAPPSKRIQTAFVRLNSAD